jgi:hypothetical protein
LNTDEINKIVPGFSDKFGANKKVYISIIIYNNININNNNNKNNNNNNNNIKIGITPP